MYLLFLLFQIYVGIQNGVDSGIEVEKKPPPEKREPIDEVD